MNQSDDDDDDETCTMCDETEGLCIDCGDCDLCCECYCAICDEPIEVCLCDDSELEEEDQ